MLPRGEIKVSTREIYARFDGAEGFAERRAAVLEIAAAGREAELAALPANDLARSPLAARLRGLGAFRADVSGAGPTLYGLFSDKAAAERAAAALESLGRVWLTTPAW
jgi:4-diphosphocytidyl-2C-methyl-D-erythritol kinase